MGVVYAARHVATDAVHALKTIKTLDPDEVLRFRREVDALVRVEGHPNMVRIHGTGEASGRLYLIQELISGGDLSDRLRRGPLPARDAATIMRDVARGLAHAHAAGVLHRDLKPANILFDEAGVPKLVDFGLAKVSGQGSLTGSTDLLGTPAYMAPEQAVADHARVDERTDVYGLGGVLYHCLAGQPPFQGSLLSVLNDVTNTAPTPPSRVAPDIDRALERICLAALTKSPGHRPPSAEALAQLLDDWLDGRSEAPNGGWLLAGLAIVILAALGLGASIRPRPPTPTASPPEAKTTARPAPHPTPSPSPKRAESASPNWTSYPQQGRSTPGERADHQLVYHPGLKRCLLYGGRTTSGLSFGLFGWDGKRWTREVEERPLPPRQEHAMAYDPRAKGIVVVGGASPTAPLLRDHMLWRDGRWRPRRRLPFKVTRPAMCVDAKGALWVFGGRARRGFSAKLLRYDSERTGWEEIEPEPNAPGPRGREQHAFAHHGGKLFLLGGYADQQVLGDFWIWDGAWTKHPLPEGLRPRRLACLVSVGDALLLFGGAPIAVGGVLSDLWLWTGTGWVATQAPETPELRGSAMAPFPPEDAVVLIGGRSTLGPWPTETRVLRGVSALPR